MLPVEQSFKPFAGLDGKPLSNGAVYFGEPNQDPITHQVTVFWDAAGTLPAFQPLRTVNGYIVNDSGAAANVFFDGPYSQTVLDSKGRQVFYAQTSDNFSIATKVSSLSKPAGSSQIGFVQAMVGAVARLLQDKARERVSVEDFGDTGNGGDDTAVIQKAIDNAAGELWFTKKAYRVDGQLVWKNGCIYRGRGVNIFGLGGTKITFNATTDDATKIVNPLNASTPANIVFKDLYFYAPNLHRQKAIIFDTASSYGLVDRCRFYTSGDGLILDQSEIWDIERSSFLLAGDNSPVGIWLVNGPDKQLGSQPYFTNRISVRSCDFNGGPTACGIRDDGGVAHTFENNNYNACGSHIIATGVNGLKIDGGEFEVSSAQSIILGTTKRNGGAGGKSPVVSITRTYLYNNTSQPVLAMVAGAVGKLDFTNNVVNTIPGEAVTGFDVGCDEVDAHGNVQVGSVMPDRDLNNHIDISPAPCAWIASNAPPSVGDGQLVASYSRRGKIITFRQRIVFGFTTTPGNGSYLFPLPFPADTSAFAQIGAAYILLVGSSYFAGVARVTGDGLYVQLFTTAASDVGHSSPGVWTPNSVIEFQISYLSAAPI